MHSQVQVVRRRRSVKQWAALLAEQVKSGLSQRAFCELRGVSLSSFYHARSRAKGLTVEGEFVEVCCAPESNESPVSSWDIELTLGGGVALRMRRV